jgi:hypothetical protein
MKVFSVAAAINIKDEELVCESHVFGTKEQADKNIEFMRNLFGIYPDAENIKEYEVRPFDNGYRIYAIDTEGEEFVILYEESDL